MTEKIYATRLVNQRRVPVMVYELDTELVQLQPGQSFEVESRSNSTMYSRWTEVTWRPDDSVHFIARSNWTEPERGRWTIKCLNQDGQDVERRVVDGRPIILPRGISVLIGLKLDDPLVCFKSMTIVRKRVMLKDPEHQGYCRFETITKDELEPRSDSELKALAKIVDELGKK